MLEKGTIIVNEDYLDESFIFPTTGERLGAAFRRMRGKETFKDKMGRRFDRWGRDAHDLFKNQAQGAKAAPRFYGALGTLAAGVLATQLARQTYRDFKPNNKTK